MRKTCPPHVGVKAAGGIRTLEQLLAFRHAGAARIGTSATAAILEECRKASQCIIKSGTSAPEGPLPRREPWGKSSPVILSLAPEWAKSHRVSRPGLCRMSPQLPRDLRPPRRTGPWSGLDYRPTDRAFAPTDRKRLRP